MFSGVAPTDGERADVRPGDELIGRADVVMDRAFDIDASPTDVWPWIVQLGKGRAGWYLPRSVERVVPRRRRAVRAIGSRWQSLDLGDVIPDYGPNGSFTVAMIDAPSTLVYRSQRGRTSLTWSLVLRPQGTGTRVLLRLRISPVKRVWLAGTIGGAFDLATIAGMAAGLRERLAS